MITKHLVVLEGGGDRDIGFVTAQQWEWIHSDPPGDGKSGWQEADPETKRRVTVTIGSYENDRAIHALTNARRFDTERQARVFAGKQRWIVSDDEYHGCIY